VGLSIVLSVMVGVIVLDTMPAAHWDRKCALMSRQEARSIVSSTSPHHYLQHDRQSTNQHSGKSYFYSSVHRRPAGGNVNTITNVFDWKYFHPISKRRNVIVFQRQRRLYHRIRR